MTEAERLAQALDPLTRKSLDNLTCAVAAALLRSQAAELEALRKDAERYRLLRDAHPADGGPWVAVGIPYRLGGVSCLRHDELDAAIDAARRRNGAQRPR